MLAMFLKELVEDDLLTCSLLNQCAFCIELVVNALMIHSKRHTAIWSHDSLYVFYVKYGSTKCTFTYLFTDIETYNTDILTASKCHNTVVLTTPKM